MADEGKISNMPELDEVSGDEYLEVIKPIAGGGFQNMKVRSDKLGGQVAADVGCVYIVDIQPQNVIDNVGSKVMTTDGHTLVSCVTSTNLVRVTVEALAGPSAFTPVVTLNGDVNVLMSRVTSDGVLFRGTANIDLSTLGTAPYTLTAQHGDGGTTEVAIAMDAPPSVTGAIFTGGYPVGQTELKAGDTMSIQFITDTAVVEYEIMDAGAFISKTGVLTPGVLHTVPGCVVADRGAVVSDQGYQIRVKKASGTWSAWFDTTAQGTQADGTSYVKLNNLYPTLTIDSITYPAGKNALDSGDSATINTTVTDANGYTYSSPNAQLSILDASTYSASKVVTHIAGTYNDSTNNFTLQVRRTANGAAVTRSVVVKLATVMPQVSISTPAARLRSGGNGGTSAQNHTITLTSNQELMEAPTLNAPEGTWSGSWVSNSDGKVWTRTLVVHDNDAKGTFTFNSLQATTISGKVQTAINAGADYTIGGFVFRTLQVAAFPNREVAIGTDVVNTAKLRCTNLSKGASGSLNFTYQADQTPGVDRYTINNGNTWYNCDGANASSNTGGNMFIELEEVV